MAPAVFTPAGKTIEVAQISALVPTLAQTVREVTSVTGALVAVVARVACAEVLTAHAIYTPAGKTIEVAPTNVGQLPMLARTVREAAFAPGALVAVVAHDACAEVLTAHAIYTPAGKTIEVARSLVQIHTVARIVPRIASLPGALVAVVAVRVRLAFRRRRRRR